jgi:DNA-directed RNA polymerase subunit RPC12/RpoP
MAEFKFFCPQCKQQIQCDATYAGSQISCPVCQQTIIVPPVPPASVAAGGRTLQIKMSTLRKAAIIGRSSWRRRFIFSLLSHSGKHLRETGRITGSPARLNRKAST